MIKKQYKNIWNNHCTSIYMIWLYTDIGKTINSLTNHNDQFAGCSEKGQAVRFFTIPLCHYFYNSKWKKIGY